MRLSALAARVPVRARYLFVLGWAIFLFGSSVTDPPTGGQPLPEPLGIPFDKWLHAVSYAALAGLLAFARRSRTPAALVGVIAVAAAYGFGIELVQSMLPVRAFDLIDAAANTVGAAVAAVVWRGLVHLDGDLAE